MVDILEKICNTCNISKPISEFYIVAKYNGKNILRNKCKICHNYTRRLSYKKKQYNRKINLPRIQNYVETHREEYNKYHREYYKRKKNENKQQST